MSSLSSEVNKIDEILSSASSVDFTIHGGTLIDFDDGHVPESLDAATHPTRLVHYSEFHEKPIIRVYDNAVDECLVDSLFEVTIREGQPWGTYVTKEQLQHHWNDESNDSKKENDDDSKRRECTCSCNDDKNFLARRVAAAFFDRAMSTRNSATTKETSFAIHSSDTATRNQDKQYTTAMLSHEQFHSSVHGIALWALSAKVGSSVPYHLDYAEQVRYASNVIVPPLLAGTLHCMPPCLQVTGGDLCMSLDGLEHYQKHGYKGALRPVEANDMVRISYQYNRLIMASGHMPHMSTRIELIEPTAPTNYDGTQGNEAEEARQRRVIIGFNVFGHDAGPLVQQAPEHSDMFRAWVHHCRQRQARTQQSQCRLTVDMVKGNPTLKQRLIQAKRNKVRADLLESQQFLDNQITTYLQVHGSKENVKAMVTIADLAAAFGRKDGSWPNTNDVHAHVYRQWKEGKYWRLVAASGALENGWNENVALARMDSSSQVELVE
ncbi:hypothetical protein MPSEU_000938500 [Mayamaea pseudoterrestris]|nr:hypothetical protein MPSEU_000938500 [Mayamaea pseudoterrestris]